MIWDECCNIFKLKSPSLVSSHHFSSYRKRVRGPRGRDLRGGIIEPKRSDLPKVQQPLQEEIAKPELGLDFLLTSPETRLTMLLQTHFEVSFISG